MNCVEVDFAFVLWPNTAIENHKQFQRATARSFIAMLSSKQVTSPLSNPLLQVNEIVGCSRMRLDESRTVTRVPWA
jgi:hypothetical protein